MRQYTALDKEIEVNGETILSVVEGMKFSRWLAQKVLNENGIGEPKAGQWYLQQKWLDSFKIIGDKLGDLTLTSIGKKVPENAKWPPEVNTITRALASIDVAYHMNHRKNGVILFDPKTGEMKNGIGHYRYHLVSETQAQITCDNPYPCAFDIGIIDAVANKFKSIGTTVTVEHKPGSCRSAGKEFCVYVIKW